MENIIKEIRSICIMLDYRVINADNGLFVAMLDKIILIEYQLFENVKLKSFAIKEWSHVQDNYAAVWTTKSIENIMEIVNKYFSRS